MKYITVNNQPGFLPDTEAQEHDSKQTAIECLLYDLEMHSNHVAEDTWNDDLQAEYDKAESDIKQHGLGYFQGYVYELIEQE